MHHERSRSGRWHATRNACIAPQSCPTRSTASPISSSSLTSQAKYSSAVAPNPSGTGAPKPGGDAITTSDRANSARSGPQIPPVSGLPFTNTTVIDGTLTAPTGKAPNLLVRGLSTRVVLDGGGGGI